MHSGSPPASKRSVQWIALWSVICGLAGLLSLGVSDARPGQVVIWLANPVGAVALLRLNRKQWPVMLVALLASLCTAKMVYVWASETQASETQLLSLSSSLYSLMVASLDVPVHLIEMLLSTIMLSRIVALANAGENVTVQAIALLRGALMPAAVLAPLGGWVWGATFNGDWHLMMLNWFTGTTIGTVAALPLALAVYTKRPRLALAQVSEPQALFMLLCCLAVTLWSGTSLPRPFVVMVAPMVWMATRTGLVAALAANFIIAACMAALIRYGVLLPPRRPAGGGIPRSTSQCWQLFYPDCSWPSRRRGSVRH